MAKCTNYTFLMVKRDGEDEFSKLIDITQYPDLGGSKEKIDVTTLSDKKKRTINGIEDTSDLEFSAWYEKADYEKLLAIEAADKVDTYQLWFGEDGEDGIFEWQGKMAVYPTSGSSNAAREMSFSITDEGDEALHYVTV
ncbi:MAG: hypothetical protein KBT03_00885 [Bacteroidales bacterium]|nr:hypothetical protein [Candidatus Scybalousia scybalohippi]